MKATCPPSMSVAEFEKWQHDIRLNRYIWQGPSHIDASDLETTKMLLWTQYPENVKEEGGFLVCADEMGVWAVIQYAGPAPGLSVTRHVTLATGVTANFEEALEVLVSGLGFSCLGTILEARQNLKQYYEDERKIAEFVENDDPVTDIELRDIRAAFKRRHMTTSQFKNMPEIAQNIAAQHEDGANGITDILNPENWWLIVPYGSSNAVALGPHKTEVDALRNGLRATVDMNEKIEEELKNQKRPDA